MPPATPHTSLAIHLDQWRGEIGRYFGFGRSYSAMTASQQADVDAVIDRGLRQFYAPPILADGSSHIWSFMRPTMNIVVHAEQKRGAISTNGLLSVASTPQGTAAFVGTSLPPWAPNGVLEYTLGSFVGAQPAAIGTKRVIHIHSVATANSLTLDDAVLDDEFTNAIGTDYTITDSIYGLPTSFGGIEGDITLDSGSGKMPVRQVSDAQIREMFLNTSVSSGTPSHFCVRPWRDPGIDRIGNRGHIGMYTRYELVFFPRADKTYQVSFRYLFVFPGVADYVATGTATTDLHPPGMAYHHETMLASCLAVAEQYADSPNGEHRAYFEKRIAASAALDRKMSGSAFIGRNLDRSDTLNASGRMQIPDRITYNNILY